MTGRAASLSEAARKSEGYDEEYYEKGRMGGRFPTANIFVFDDTGRLLCGYHGDNNRFGNDAPDEWRTDRDECSRRRHATLYG